MDPSRDAQLDAYAPRFSAGAAADLACRFVTLSDSTAAWAHHALPKDVAGVPVIHWSWDEVRELISEARGSARGHERNWLDQMEAYMGAATSRRPITDSLAYCIVITDDLFGDATFRDYVVNQRVYFHPLTGGGWPTVPPNFLAFRWKGAVRQVNRVLEHEIVTRLSDRYPTVADDDSVTSRPPEEPHVLYHLGPDIPLPNGAIPSGPPGLNLRAQRFWVLLDQLLTAPTLVEARDATKALGAT